MNPGEGQVPQNGMAGLLPVEFVPLDQLRPHPRNYRQHPADQLAHIQQSIREHGVYRNVVVAEDYTILAGHGVVKAMREMGAAECPVVRVPVDPNSAAALKLLAGDNEIGHLAEVDDRMFIELLQEVKTLDSLMGTGYDEMMLANLIFVTTNEHEVKDEQAAWEAAGMPKYDSGALPFKLMISFRTESDRARYCEQTKLEVAKKESGTWSTWWPYRDMQDLASLRFERANSDDRTSGEDPAAEAQAGTLQAPQWPQPEWAEREEATT